MTPPTMRQLRSLVRPDGMVELSIATVDTPVPRSHEVLVRIQAAPINPSDLGLLLASADVTQLSATGTGADRVVTAPIAPAAMAALAGRVGESMPVGNEGCGVVVAAGDGPAAQALLGRTVSVIGGATYGEYRTAPAAAVLPLPDGTDPADGASWFVNPFTALGMTETMRAEGHRALVHTAAASNLGQMLNRICLADGIGLVNVVRRPEQAELLRSQGAEHVVDSSDPAFAEHLTAAIAATGATIAFDAIGGGRIAGQILQAMETAAMANADGPYNRYGSTTHKQVYIYGSLDRGPTEVVRTFGFAWSLGGWLLTPFLMGLGAEGNARLRQRVVDELTTTFASHYTDHISLADVLDPEVLVRYARQATGQKFLIRPDRWGD